MKWVIIGVLLVMPSLAMALEDAKPGCFKEHGSSVCADKLVRCTFDMDKDTELYGSVVAGACLAIMQLEEKKSILANLVSVVQDEKRELQERITELTARNVELKMAIDSSKLEKIQLENKLKFSAPSK